MPAGKEALETEAMQQAEPAAAASQWSESGGSVNKRWQGRRRRVLYVATAEQRATEWHIL